ncbi:MAG: hypothetical protein FJ125_17610 [Deltaproteobacteria bacterium]|nr:hypothetical protein [Deltaproteobacteria bacterium]
MPEHRCRTAQPVLLILVVALALATCPGGCWIGDTPAPELPAVDASVGGGGCDHVCDCLAKGGGGDPTQKTGLDGRIYRFTMMKVEEPYLLAGILNAKWSSDLDDRILNVLFSVDSSEPSHTGYVARKVLMRAASGWRSPGQINLAPGEEVESFHMLKGTCSPIELQPNRECNDRCQLATVGKAELNFFAGSLEEPINCAPELTPQHVVPLTQMKASFIFNEDCSRLLQGNLTACLLRSAAERLCMCPGPSGSCKLIPTEPSDDPNLYCNRCGTGQMWFNLAAALPDLPGVNPDLPACDPPLGDAGYKVTGIFEGEEITELFDASRSSDCNPTE